MSEILFFNKNQYLFAIFGTFLAITHSWLGLQRIRATRWVIGYGSKSILKESPGNFLPPNFELKWLDKTRATHGLELLNRNADDDRFNVHQSKTYVFGAMRN